jgi:hydroxyacylglutathione hydrolase
MIGSKKQAAVIDPRRDIDVYLDTARNEGVNITHIFETHRNEDYVIGSLELAYRTGAHIFHGKALNFDYGNGVQEDDLFSIGDLQIRVLETPGHTFESISLVLQDKTVDSKAVGIFTGDTLFIGDVGRTDFYPGRDKEVADLLFESITEKIMPLGDDVILYPAHGSGSVCGSKLSERDFSTLGIERRTNPMLRKRRDEFVEFKIHERHNKPPYFRRMEELNQHGAPLMYNLPLVPALNADKLEDKMWSGMVTVDIRSPEAYAGAHIPGSISIPLNMLPAFAGWFLPYDREIVLITETPEQVDTALRYLLRVGYELFGGYLSKGALEWIKSGRSYERIPTIDVRELTNMIRNNEKFQLLDVRSMDEYEESHLPGAKHIYVGKLPERIDELSRDSRIITFCGSGRRSLIAASILKNNGFMNVENCFGSMKACKATECKEMLVK